MVTVCGVVGEERVGGGGGSVKGGGEGSDAAFLER